MQFLVNRHSHTRLARMMLVPSRDFVAAERCIRLRNRLYSALNAINLPLRPSSLPLAEAQQWRSYSPWKHLSPQPNA